MERLYLATMLALIVHQIDAAYWHEWDMFAVPGGIQGFLIFNACAIGMLLWGYRSVLQRQRSAKVWAQVCGGLGVGTCALHAAFALSGRPEFSLPLSIVTLVGCCISGGCLLIAAHRLHAIEHRRA